jgi:hypothetical protein
MLWVLLERRGKRWVEMRRRACCVLERGEDERAHQREGISGRLGEQLWTDTPWVTLIILPCPALDLKQSWRVEELDLR